MIILCLYRRKIQANMPKVNVEVNDQCSNVSKVMILLWLKRGLIYWVIGYLSDWLTVSWIGWLIGWLTGWFPGQLIGWLFEFLVTISIDRFNTLGFLDTFDRALSSW